MNLNTRRKSLRNVLIMAFVVLSIPVLFQSCKQTEEKEQPTEKIEKPMEPWFDISLAAYSLHRAFEAEEITNMDFPRIAKERFGIEAVEFLNIYFMDKAQDTTYLEELNRKSKELGVKHLLIMVDREGDLGTPVERDRKEAVQNHYKWVEAAAALGCHSIRVNARGEGTPEQVKEAAIDGLSMLGKYAADFNINVIVENHGGISSDGKWLSSVLAGVGMDNVGSLPDFGNFCIKGKPQGAGECEVPYDRYQGTQELMPFAKGVSAKSYNFDENGGETTIDYGKMLQVVKESGYKGYIGIEYEGNNLSEDEGIKATQKLLEKYRTGDFGS